MNDEDEYDDEGGDDDVFRLSFSRKPCGRRVPV